MFLINKIIITYSKRNARYLLVVLQIIHYNFLIETTPFHNIQGPARRSPQESERHMMIMKTEPFIFYDGSTPITYLISEADYEGVRRIAKVHTEDFEAVCGVRPSLLLCAADSIPMHSLTADADGKVRVVIAGTLNHNPVIDSICTAYPQIADGVSGKREVYRMTTLSAPAQGIDEALVIAGSDKRGTIYGLFKLSELFGISPWIWWADVQPETRSELSLPAERLNFISKEPSVRYRGFFINDEWPSFGSWTTGMFGDFNAQMYDKMFQLLLRMKGNYLWPAMWSASFPLDGPGLGNVELADIYGVVMGESHHEPCCRASEEWDKVRGVDTVYGNEWNFYTNREGLLRYWDEALARNSKYETMITIGMRGERDSSMLGDHSSLQQNIDLLRDIITEQNKLIKKNVNEDLSKVPRLLALYKEVESYYYGDENTTGLIDFEELDDVTIMLCEDNYGNMRTLPPKELRDRKGGWGMYYHFDYHGGPISYEWVNSTPLTKVWEQMSMAYDYGIRDVWIVNVGDLKPQELPLNYFMDLAYDFETYGTLAPNTTHAYIQNWVNKQFPFAKEQGLTDDITEVLEGYTRINGMRRPEAMNQNVYPADRGNEASLMLLRANKIINLAATLDSKIPQESYDAFWQLVYFPAVASMNVQRMSLLAALSVQSAKEHSKVANEYANAVTESIQLDKKLTHYYNNKLSNGKWKGMMSSKHIGFQSWNDERWFYPITANYTPVSGAKLLAYPVAPDRFPRSLRPFEIPAFVASRTIGSSDNFEALCGHETRGIRLVNAGEDDFGYTVNCDADWLTIDADTDYIIYEAYLRLQLNPEALTQAFSAAFHADTAQPSACDETHPFYRTLTATITINGAGSTIKFPVSVLLYELPETIQNATILSNRSAIIPSASYAENKKAQSGAEWKLLTEYGYAKDAIKAYPTTENYEDPSLAPTLTYQLIAQEEGNYELAFRVAPSNHLTAKVQLRFALSVNNQDFEAVDTLPEGFIAGAHWNGPWCQNVLDNYRLVRRNVRLNAGLNTIRIAVADAGVVLQEILIC